MAASCRGTLLGYPDCLRSLVTLLGVKIQTNWRKKTRFKVSSYQRYSNTHNIYIYIYRLYVTLINHHLSFALFHLRSLDVGDLAHEIAKQRVHTSMAMPQNAMLVGINLDSSCSSCSLLRVFWLSALNKLLACDIAGYRTLIIIHGFKQMCWSKWILRPGPLIL